MTPKRPFPPALLPFLIWIAMLSGSWVGSKSGGLSLPFMDGFFLAILTTIVARIRRRTAGHVLARAGLAAVLGAIASAIADPGPALGGNASYLFLIGPSLLVWPWGAPPDPPREVGAQVGRAWALPFLLAMGQTLGSAFGFGLAAGSEIEQDPTGSLVAILVFTTAVVTFVVSGVTVAFRAFSHRPAADRLAFRAGLSVVTGGLNGALAWILRTSDFSVLGSLVLIVAAIVLSIPWPVARGRRVSS